MSHVIERFPSLDITSLAAELGGILFTPSVFVNCLISSKNHSSLYHGAVLNILGRSTDFMLKGYMIEIDKHIVKDNLINARAGGIITPEKFGIIEGALNWLTTLKCSPCVEVEANIRSGKMSLYDARRLETAFQHDLTVLTCEPEDFTSSPDELSHIFRYEYVDVQVGSSIDIDDLEKDTCAKVWLFKPEALATILNRFNPNFRICETNRNEILSLVDFEVSSKMSGSHAHVQLSMGDKFLTGNTHQEGPIDAVLRAIENALVDVIDLSDCDVHHRVSDTTTEKDSIRVRIRLNIPERYFERVSSPINCFESTDESQNMLLSTAQAYVKALNTFLKELLEESMQ